MIELGGIPTPLGIDALIETSGGMQLVVTMAVERDPPHRIESLLFSPNDQATPEFAPLDNWSELDTALAAARANNAVFAGALDENDALTTVHELNPGAVLPIGSAFKLYVLGALTTAIEDGRLHWSDVVEVTESLVSLPSGVTQNELSGSTLPLDELARRMISISDNTATDMLIATVGRDACEGALGPMGNSVPERNMPFLTTRELFTIKLADPELLAAFEAADPEDRRELLETTVAGLPLPTAEQGLSWTSPIAIETIEWFATMEDLGRAMAWLWAASERPGMEPVKEILTLNPGIPLELDAWPVVAFKGGSETGVMALSWLLERGDGERFTFAAAVSDPERAIDEQAVIEAVAGAFALLESA